MRVYITRYKEGTIFTSLTPASSAILPFGRASHFDSQVSVIIIMADEMDTDMDATTDVDMGNAPHSGSSRASSDDDDDLPDPIYPYDTGVTQKVLEEILRHPGVKLHCLAPLQLSNDLATNNFWLKDFIPTEAKVGEYVFTNRQQPMAAAGQGMSVCFTDRNVSR